MKDYSFGTNKIDFYELWQWQKQLKTIEMYEVWLQIQKYLIFLIIDFNTAHADNTTFFEW